jgi:carboxyl-terminal processing protease
MARTLAALAAALLVAAVPAFAQDARRNLEDFDAMWRSIDTGYAYFEGSHAAWKRAREAWRPRARAAKTRADLVLALEGALAHLCDDHVSLSEPAPGSARAVPADTDLWAEWRGGSAVVTAVRPFGDADVAGIHPGHVIVSVDGVPVERAARDRVRAIGPCGEGGMDWALRRLVAGPRSGTVRLAVKGSRGTQTVDIERTPATPANGPPLIARRMGDARDIGYIRIRNVLADARLPTALDGALNYLKDTRALILDLRDTADGGTRAVVDATEARLSARTGALFVLVDRWTAGEGEALAANLDARGATLVGTRMAGLRGELREVTLPASGIVVRFPARRTQIANGTPRERLRPRVEVDLAAPSGGPGDPILYQGLKLAEASAGRVGRNAPR